MPLPLLRGVSRPIMAGVFAGAGTNAASMQAAMEAATNSDPAVGYGLAFPIGLVGAILCMYFMQLIVKPNLDAVSKSELETAEIAIRSAEAAGRPLREVISRLPMGVQVLMVRVRGENRHPQPELVIHVDDVLLLAGNGKASLDAARDVLGERVVGRITGDRSTTDSLRVFVSRPNFSGMHLSEIRFPSDVEATVTHVQRGDTEMLVTPDLSLELGDRVGLITARNSFKTLRNFFGNSIRGTSEFSYIALGIGIVLGVLLGIVPIPIPMLGTLKLGIAGGSLIVALILGKLGRTWKLTWTMPISANLTLRNFGLSVFLAQVGMSSGAPFVKVIQESGLILLAASACILLALALTPLLIGHFVMRMPFDDLLGVTAGVTGTPAILAYGYRSYPSERVEVCYAMIYPATTILKILVAQLLIRIGTGW